MKLEDMKMLKEYSEKFGIPEVVNFYGEHRRTRVGSITFPNGWVASIIQRETGEYSVAMCDYNGYFDWSILNQYGAEKGRNICHTELDILMACENIRRLPD